MNTIKSLMTNAARLHSKLKFLCQCKDQYISRSF